MKFKYLLALPLVAALTACSSDEPAPTPDDGAEMPFYTTMAITSPTTGRYEVTSPVVGEEHGQESENNVSSVKVILTTRSGKEGSYTYTKLVESVNVTPLENTTYTVMFDAKELVANTDLEKAGMDVYAFVVCNDGSFTDFDINKTFTGSAPDKYDANQTPIRMTSAPYAAKLPKVSELLKHDTEAKAYDLTAQANGASGPIKVERTVARFDFKSNGEGENANKFTIKQGSTVRGYVKITDMALINENNEAYYFGRTNNDGKATTTTGVTHQLLASITNIGVSDVASLLYVVNPKDLDNRVFNNPLSSDGVKTDLDLSKLSFTSIATLTQDDNHTTWDKDESTDKAGYKIWRYCNENAIPASSTTSKVNDNQKNGVTTGIVFKGEILNGDGDNAIPGYETATELYRYRQIMYGDFSALYAAAYSTGEKANPDLQAAFKKTWVTSETGTYIVKKADGSEVKYALIDGQTRGGNGFTVYKRDAEGKFPVYYYYWNRHDDNGQSNVMEAMEFSVVRNNVYKLFISSINMFGCSGTDDDPDEPDPDNPDETEHMFIKVDVMVMPWTVRLNNIEF